MATKRLLESPTLEDIALKNLLLETAVNVLSEAVREKDQQLAQLEAKLFEAYGHIGAMAAVAKARASEVG